MSSVEYEVRTSEMESYFSRITEPTLQSSIVAPIEAKEGPQRSLSTDSNSDEDGTHKKDEKKANIMLMIVLIVTIIVSVAFTLLLYFCVKKRVMIMAARENAKVEEEKLAIFRSKTSEVQSNNSEIKFEQTECCICLQAFEKEEALRKMIV